MFIVCQYCSPIFIFNFLLNFDIEKWVKPKHDEQLRASTAKNRWNGIAKSKYITNLQWRHFSFRRCFSHYIYIYIMCVTKLFFFSFCNFLKRSIIWLIERRQKIYEEFSRDAVRLETFIFLVIDLAGRAEDLHSSGMFNLELWMRFFLPGFCIYIICECGI